MNRVISLCILSALLLAPVVSADLRIVPMDAAAVPVDAPVLPSVESQAAFWETRPALWEATTGEISVRTWIAANPRALRLHLVVKDPEHSNPYHERNLWRGDCIYVSLDARGDTTGAALASRDLPPDDATFVFALGSEGAEGRCTQHGNKSLQNSNQTALVRSIRRDEPAGATIYDLEFPWSALGTTWGQSDTIGMALNIAHKDSEGQDTAWGKMRAAADAPRQLNVLRLNLGDAPVLSVAPRRTQLTDPTHRAEAVVAIRSGSQAEIIARLGEQTVTTRYAGEGALVRYLVQAPAKDVSAEAASLQILVRSASGQVAQDRQFALSTPDVALAKLQARLRALREGAPNDIVRDHLDSTRDVVRSARIRLDHRARTDPGAVEEFLQLVELIRDKLPTDRFDWDDHVRRGLPLVLAFVSDRDRTLQFCSLQMPFAYEPGRKYPLTVYLHGAGSPNPLSNLSTSFDNTHQDTLFTFDAIDPANVPPSHRGFVLAPWARGNSMYRDAGEDDVWQAIDMVEKRFAIDPDRRYLSGFSMGCGGAWGIGARRPDFWAGVNLSSGFGTWSDTDLSYLDENLRGIPLAVWIGELDRMVDGARALHERLNAAKIDHRFETIPRLPHTYPYTEFQKNIGYLMQFTRSRPTPMTFTTDTRNHDGRNGVRMAVPRYPDPNALPTFTCTIKGQTVTIDSRNTPDLRVNLGPDGLGLDGEVTVVWNGKETYKGPASEIRLGNAR
jgi:predicted esterase